MFYPPTRRVMTCELQRIGKKGWKRKEEPFLLPVTNILLNGGCNKKKKWNFV
ncbi:hypothetical protein SAMN05216299_12117 [Nitrosospira sp. Nsp14]|nr:hypothetical protein SAMN05216299_12117 [Nitrosospira sp. Nsp14]